MEFDNIETVKRAVEVESGVSIVPSGGAGGIVKLSTTLPSVQLTSFSPPPAGPQMNEPSIPEGVKCSRRGPQRIARKAENAGGGQGQVPSHGCAQRQAPSCSRSNPPVPIVTCTTPDWGEVRS